MALPRPVHAAIVIGSEGIVSGVDPHFVDEAMAALVLVDVHALIGVVGGQGLIRLYLRDVAVQGGLVVGR